MEFEFNHTQAAQSDTFGGQRIKTSGAYIGFFSEFYESSTKSGGKMIVVNFVSETGETAKSWLTYKSAQGTSDSFPFDMNLSLIQSLIGLLELKSLRETRIMIDVKDKVTKAVIPTAFKSFPDVLKKRIGVVYECSPSTYNGKPSVDVSLVRFFDPETQQTYAEKAANKTAEIIPALIKRFASEPAKAALTLAQATQTSSADFTAQPSSDFDFDDDIPFSV
jgi:hypothetical protein